MRIVVYKFSSTIILFRYSRERTKMPLTKQWPCVATVRRIRAALETNQALTVGKTVQTLLQTLALSRKDTSLGISTLLKIKLRVVD